MSVNSPNIPTLSTNDLALMHELAKYSLRFSAAIAFGGRGKAANETTVNNGTVALVKLGGQKFGVSNYHVIDAYRKRQEQGEVLSCVVGNVEIDPIARLHSESSIYDLAVLDLSGIDVARIRGSTEIPCQFNEPRIWPTPMPKEGEFVLFGGFPLTKRKVLNPTEIEFGSMSSGGTRVHSVQPDVLSAQIEIDQCVISYDRDGKGFQDLPGISGCPVMATRVVSGVGVIDLIGIVFEYHSDWDLMRFRPVTLIGENGQIATHP